MRAANTAHAVANYKLDNDFTNPVYQQTRGHDALRVTIAHEFLGSMLVLSSAAAAPSAAGDLVGYASFLSWSAWHETRPHVRSHMLATFDRRGGNEAAGEIGDRTQPDQKNHART